MTDTAPIKNPMDEFQTKLAAVMDRVVGGSAPIENSGRLSGGANMESWSFDRAGKLSLIHISEPTRPY